MSRAFRNDDILTMFSGKTVEVREREFFIDNLLVQIH